MFELLLMSDSLANQIKAFFDFIGPALLWVALLVGFFLVMILPQRKHKKQIKEMLDNMKIGDKVRTLDGIYGTIHQMENDKITLTVGPDKVKLVFAKGAIATVENAEVERTLEDGIDIK